MTQIPQGAGRTRFAVALWAAWAAGVITTALGFAAPFVPALDLINQCRPLAALGAVILFAAAIGMKEWRLIRPTMALALLLVGLLLLPWARAGETAPNAAPALRLVTFNLTARNDRFDEIADFILSSGADIVLLQEVCCTAADRLIPKLGFDLKGTLRVLRVNRIANARAGPGEIWVIRRAAHGAIPVSSAGCGACTTASAQRARSGSTTT